MFSLYFCILFFTEMKISRTNNIFFPLVKFFKFTASMVSLVSFLSSSFTSGRLPAVTAANNGVSILGYQGRKLSARRACREQWRLHPGLSRQRVKRKACIYEQRRLNPGLSRQRVECKACIYEQRRLHPGLSRQRVEHKVSILIILCSVRISYNLQGPCSETSKTWTLRGNSKFFQDMTEE